MAKLRRIEDSHRLSRLFQLREYAEYRWKGAGKRAAFEELRAARGSDRVFVIGNGPSLSDMDLTLLDGEKYFVVNMAENIEWARGRTHPYYLAGDMAVTEKYVNGRPGLNAKNYFFSEKLRPKLNPKFVQDSSIFFYEPAKGGLIKRGLSTRPYVSVGSGRTILVTAAQLAFGLGFKKIYIVGCDLDYAGADVYAYGSTAAERDAARLENTLMCEKGNRQFGFLHDEMKPYGVDLINAGVGGKLSILPRTPFHSLF